MNPPAPEPALLPVARVAGESDWQLPIEAHERRTVLRWLTGGLPLLLLGPGALVTSSCGRVEETGRWQLALVPEGQMNALADQAWQQIQAEEQRSTDPEALAMLARVGEGLNRYAEGGTFEFTLFESQTMNAFALPNGKVAVYTGLLRQMRNEAQLAAVVGHEIGHVVARHGNERVTQQLGVEVFTQLAAVGLGSSEVSPQTQQIALAAIGGLGTVGVILPFSRKHELEADRLGATYMAKAGYDPQQAVEFWRTFSALGASGQPPELLSTHPHGDTRIDQLQDRMSVYQSLYQQSSQLGEGKPVPAAYRS